ncbi:MAG: glycine--tRNA ligase subunit beta [Neisseriaceae bacterium]|nr:MAG: glycine--tRNA ligase subunit beta [Neisseriaceae bacterium]
MNKETLLVELRTEELPPNVLEKLGRSFASLIFEGLVKEKMVEKTVSYQFFATPRRLALLIPEVQSEQRDQEKIKKGPSIAIGMVDGEPSRALQGFLKSNNISLQDLCIMHDGKQEIYCYQFFEKGLGLATILQMILDVAVKKLPVPKLMHWGDKSYTFVRPVHSLIAMLGEDILPVHLFGLKADNKTLGHRFMSTHELIELKHSNQYEKLLEKNYVKVNFETRKNAIKQQIQDRCSEINAQWVAEESLFDEVTGLVEWPVTLVGTFAPEFLEIPAECLILTMQKNQKYFPLMNAEQKLLNTFLLVSNIESANPEEVIAGNERVVRARLSDAAFFYNVDRKVSLESRLHVLENVIYNNKIGCQYDRVQRLMEISSFIARQLGIDETKVRRAAQLAKADLVTEMVGEFPELQGVMGKYYALNDNEDSEVAKAIEEHYWPKFANDVLPSSEIGIAVSLADKLETLIGIWGIGLIPTGDKDPYALRRSALGIVRILLEFPLNIQKLLEFVYQTFPKGLLSTKTVSEVYQFILTRLAVYLQNKHTHDVVMASLAKQPEEFSQLSAILIAIENFKNLPEALALSETNKRVSNILKKNNFSESNIHQDKLHEKAEIILWENIQVVSCIIETALQNRDYQSALNVLAKIKPKVDAFFDEVMVISADTQIRENRLNLLNVLSKKLNAVADISYLS